METSPNANFSTIYGSPSDSASLLSKSNVICIRHAFSKANESSHVETERLFDAFPNITREELRKKKLLIHKDLVNYPFLLDSEIIDDIAPFIAQQTQYISDINFQTVLVSPQRRTIQTAVHLLKGHPQGKFVLKLCPLAKEIT